MKRTVNTLLCAITLAVGASTLGAAENGGATLKQLSQRTKTLEQTAERPQDHQALAADYRQLALLQRDEALKLDQRAAWYAQFPIYTSDKFRRSTIDTRQYFA